MLPRADLHSTNARPVGSITAPTPVLPEGDARQELLQRLSQVALGKQLQAEVLSLLDDGTYLVKVADAAARMALPTGTRVGDRLPLALIARGPRPAFLLLQPEGSAPASLSPAARLIDHILQVAQQQPGPAAIPGRTPLLPAQPLAVNVEQLAQAMQEHIELSGAFYESHLEEWAAGRRPAELVQREPQAQGGALIQHGSTAPPPPAVQRALAAAAGMLPSLLPGAAEGQAHAAGHALQEAQATPEQIAMLARNLPANTPPQRVLEMMRELQTQPGYAAIAATTDADLLRDTAAVSVPAVEPEAAAMINQQLNALEQHQVQWQGELWPGQQMEWSVRDETPEGRRGEAAAEQTWSSRVRFRLPSLGEVDATVRLAGGHVQIDVRTGDEATAGALRSNAPLLADALAAAGSPLDSLLVKGDGTP